MPAVRNIAGERFGRLVAIERVSNSNTGKAVWRCRCDCGRVFKTDVLDETMCPACLGNARRHREAQAGVGA